MFEITKRVTDIQNEGLNPLSGARDISISLMRSMHVYLVKYGSNKRHSRACAALKIEAVASELFSAKLPDDIKKSFLLYVIQNELERIDHETHSGNLRALLVATLKPISMPVGFFIREYAKPYESILRGVFTTTIKKYWYEEIMRVRLHCEDRRSQRVFESLKQQITQIPFCYAAFKQRVDAGIIKAGDRVLKTNLIRIAREFHMMESVFHIDITKPQSPLLPINPFEMVNGIPTSTVLFENSEISEARAAILPMSSNTQGFLYSRTAIDTADEEPRIAPLDEAPRLQ